MPAYGTILFTLALALRAAAETTLGVVMFSRHGDRTSKLFPPTSLTNLGQVQVHSVGEFYRTRYIVDGAPQKIDNISSAEWDPLLYAIAPDEATLVNTGAAFLQGLYPPTALDVEVLANNTPVPAPLGGYQYAWLHGIVADAPEAIWMKSDTGCPVFTKAAATYAQSNESMTLVADTKSFYQQFAPLLDGVFPDAQQNYGSAYAIFDYLNVGVVHNSTIANALQPGQLDQLRTLADAHEFAQTFNASEPVGSRSIPGRTFAGKVRAQLNQTMHGAAKFSLLVGSYDTLQAFFGLAGLQNVAPNWVGLPDYAATLVFELVTNTTAVDASVRVLFRNGSAEDAPLQAVPVFGSADGLMSWNDFNTRMAEVEISTAAQWCSVCNATAVFCPAPIAAPVSFAAKTMALSDPIAGLVGAIVALSLVGVAAVIAGFMGVRLRRKERREQVLEKGHLPQDNDSNSANSNRKV